MTPSASPVTEVEAPSRVDAAMAGLRSAVPLTMSLLSLDERVEIDVAVFLYGARRPQPLPLWAADFLRSLLEDEDDLVRNVARYELLALGHKAPALAVWAWDRDPLAVVVDLLCGDDPRRIPLADHPVLVDVEVDGRLTFTGRVV